MNKLLLGACVAALVSGAANAQQHFTFTDQMDNSTSGPGLITGSFDGTLSGNLITNISNVAMSFDGTPFSSNGSFYVERYEPGGCYTNFCAGGATASLDGTDNNFLFINSDYAAGDYSFNQYFYSISHYGIGDWAYKSEGQAYGATHFTAQLAAVPEPASWALMLGGFGAIGGAMRSRRKAAVTFA